MNNSNTILKIDLKDCLNLQNDDKIYKFLFDNAFELGKKIIELKNIDYKPLYDEGTYMELFSMSECIYYNSIWFDSYRSLVSFIRDWDVDFLDEESNSTEYKAQIIVKVYNELIDEIDEYKAQKEKIEKEGLQNLESQLLKGLREIFCKMLDYKKRNYNKDGSLFDLINELVLCYGDYKWLFDETYTMLKKFIYRDTVRDDFWRIDADNVEYISNLEFTYNFFAKNEDNYKSYQQFYEDITLKEGQTLKDLYDEEREKLKKLFVEMLEFLNIEIEDKNNYYTIEALVGKYYPYYYPNLTSINGAHRYSYIELINTIKLNYDYFKNTYKNHKEDFKEYIKKEEEYIEESINNDELLYDDRAIDRVNKLKSYFSDYFENE